jgi:uncharacterized SAM-binding protein YcdF (DUF218 family)
MDAIGMTSPSDSVTRKAGRLFGGMFRFVMKLVIVLIFIGGGVLVGGFLKFSNTVTSYDVGQSVEKADGIVVVTGGSARIAKALDLLAAKKGDRLLISGVNPQTKMIDLQNINPAHKNLFECCVEIERKAQDTVGNAAETQKWNTEQKSKSLILVTSGYHMPRSLLEFRRAMPDVKFTGYSVPLRELQQDDWWQDSGTLRLMVFEYIKYIGAWSRNFLTPKTFQTVRSSLLN